MLSTTDHGGESTSGPRDVAEVASAEAKRRSHRVSFALSALESYKKNGGDLIPANPAEKTAEHGQAVPMQRPGQPDEIARCYMFLASADASYMTGQVLHPNGGSVING